MIGDAVNVAARVEAQTRHLDASVLVAERTREQLSDEFELEDLGSHRLKGVEEPVSLHAPKRVASDERIEAGEGFDGAECAPLAVRALAAGARRATRTATRRP